MVFLGLVQHYDCDILGVNQLNQHWSPQPNLDGPGTTVPPGNTGGAFHNGVTDVLVNMWTSSCVYTYSGQVVADTDCEHGWLAQTGQDPSVVAQGRS